MAKKQTRRSISVSRMTYERLKAFCEANNISMSQLVENRVNDFLGGESVPTAPTRPTPSGERTSTPLAPRPQPTPSPAGSSGTAPKPQQESRPPAPAAPVPMTAASARFAVEPPPPIIKQKQQENAPAPAEKRPDQIFTF